MNREQNAADILSPRAVAVVGVSSEPGKIGSRIFSNIVAGGFRGEVSAVNLAGIVIGGKPTFRSLTELPAPADLVIVAVPASNVESVVAEAIQRGAQTIIVISAGFAEVGESGRILERRLVARARESGARLIGPNCFGVINADPAVRLQATFGRRTDSGVSVAGGSVAFASQSGAMGILFLERASRYGLGVRKFVSLGNSADLTVHELIEVWGNDPAIDVIALYLEGSTAGSELVRIGREVSVRKPIFALTAGRTDTGKRAALSHTAAVASSAEGIDAVLESAGIVRVETFNGLLEATAVATHTGVPRGERVGVITNSGGPGILFADRAVSRGLELPTLSSEAQAELRSRLSKEASLVNPIDLTAAGSPVQLEAAMRALVSEVDIVVVIVVDIGLSPLERFTEVVRRFQANEGRGVPIILVLPTGTGDVRLESEQRRVLPVLDTVEGTADAVAGIAQAMRYKEKISVAVPVDQGEIRRLRDLVPRWCEPGAERWLRWREIEAFLMLAGIPCVRGWEGPLESIADGVTIIGYPMVAKLVLPGVLHKSDIGGVATDIRDAQAFKETTARFRKLASDYLREATVILQPFIPGGREGFVGLTVDEHLGPLISCGWGGVLLEALHDTVLQAPPISAPDAKQMVDRLRFRKLLEPFRRAPPHDRRMFEDIIVRLGAVTTALPEIVECDLNPVRIFPEGEGCLVLDARIRVRGR